MDHYKHQIKMNTVPQEDGTLICIICKGLQDRHNACTLFTILDPNFGIKLITMLCSIASLL